jgi:hypothetical protein
MYNRQNVCREDRSVLAGGGVGGGETSVRTGPDTVDAATRANEDGGGSQGNEGQQEGVLDQILALLVVYEVLHEVFHCVFSLSDELIHADFPRYGEYQGGRLGLANAPNLHKKSICRPALSRLVTLSTA